MPAYKATFTIYYFYHIYGVEVMALMKEAAAGGAEAAHNLVRGISYRCDWWLSASLLVYPLHARFLSLLLRWCSI